MTKKLQTYFWLAVLAHLLLLLSFSFALVYEPELQFEKKSDRYLPAYLYQKESHLPAATNPSPENAAQNTTTTAATETTPPPPKALAPQQIALEKKIQRQAASPSQAKAPQSSAFIQAESLKAGKPIDEPLLKELSRATSAKLFYPPEAAAFKIKGMVTISFMLYPDGRVTDITLAKSSGFRVLDEAALNTIRSISPVRDANMYLTKPRYLLAGIIFG